VTDLERFFERLVRNLVAIDSARVKQPVAVVDIKTTVMPYRTNRRALGLESSEEYEELLVRLVGEEGGLVKTTPSDVAEWCQRQMASLTPDLSGIPGQANAAVTVTPAALARVLGPAAMANIEAGKPATSGSTGELPLPPEKCPHCSTTLPSNRAVNFCPVCGRSVTMIPCDNCGADLEPGWRFCVNCGQDVAEAGTPPA
jgi:hypothetical protein